MKLKTMKVFLHDRYVSHNILEFVHIKFQKTVFVSQTLKILLKYQLFKQIFRCDPCQRHTFQNKSQNYFPKTKHFSQKNF
jgi:uncharacterized CHY-type Zn-finger protein